jgi:hypothetical protein
VTLESRAVKVEIVASECRNPLVAVSNQDHSAPRGRTHMTTTDELQDQTSDGPGTGGPEVDEGADGFEAVVDLVDTDPVPLVEGDEEEDDYERRASEHLGLDDPHDETDVLDGVELTEDGD